MPCYDDVTDWDSNNAVAETPFDRTAIEKVAKDNIDSTIRWVMGFLNFLQQFSFIKKRKHTLWIDIS